MMHEPLSEQLGALRASVQEEHASSGKTWFPEETLKILDAFVSRREGPTNHIGFVELEREHERVAAVERKVDELSRYEESLRRFLKFYGVDAVVRKVSDGLFAIPVVRPHPEFLEALPDGFAYSGGVARAVLLRSLGTDPYAVPRDRDVVCFDPTSDEEMVESISRKFMPNDYEHGHGVQRVGSDYMKTRDFTVNELFATDTAVFCSKQCLLDTLRGVVRFSEYEKQESYYGNPYHVRPKLLAKALRFAAQSGATIADREIYEFQEIDAFHMALHLDRAFESGNATAIRYVDELRSRGQIPEDIQDPEMLVEYLSEQTDFVFRCAPRELMKLEEEHLNGDAFRDIAETYEHLPKRTGRRGF